MVIIPGNHDAPKRWSAVAPLLQRFSVFVVPEVLRPERGGVVEVSPRGRHRWRPDRRPALGDRAEHDLGDRDDGSRRGAEPSLCRRNGATDQGSLRTLDPTKCTVFAGHLFVSGATLGGGERSLTVGQIYGVTPQAMPQVQYVALGHVHRPQRVPGSAVPARYAGSLLQLDFGEREQKKSVALVELAPGKAAEVREIPITAGRQLLDVSGTMEELAGLPRSRRFRLSARDAEIDGPRPGLADEVRERLPNAIEVRLEYPRGEEAPASPPRDGAPGAVRPILRKPSRRPRRRGDARALR